MKPRSIVTSAIPVHEDFTQSLESKVDVKVHNLTAVCLAVALLLHSASAVAGDTKGRFNETIQAAEEHIHKGIELRRSGDDIGRFV